MHLFFSGKRPEEEIAENILTTIENDGVLDSLFDDYGFDEVFNEPLGPFSPPAQDSPRRETTKEKDQSDSEKEKGKEKEKEKEKGGKAAKKTSKILPAKEHSKKKEAAVVEELPPVVTRSRSKSPEKKKNMSRVILPSPTQQSNNFQLSPMMPPPPRRSQVFEGILNPLALYGVVAPPSEPRGVKRALELEPNTDVAAAAIAIPSPLAFTPVPPVPPAPAPAPADPFTNQMMLPEANASQSPASKINSLSNSDIDDFLKDLHHGSEPPPSNQ